MKLRTLIFCFLVSLIFTHIMPPVRAADATYIPGQFLVRFQPGQSPEEIQEKILIRHDRARTLIGPFQNALEDLTVRMAGDVRPEDTYQKSETVNTKYNLQSSKKLFTNLKHPNPQLVAMRVMTFASDTPLTDIIADYRQLSNVLSIEPNYIFKALVIPNDQYYPFQWNLTKIRMPAAWDIHKGSPQVKVAVIDTGVDYTNQDFSGVPIIRGPDYVNNDSDPMDDANHGTEVAGIIAAATNNTIGISGTVWYTTLLVIKALDAAGSGTTDKLISAIAYATDQGANVINLSLGGQAPCSSMPSVQSVLDYAYQHGVVVVAAAGNSNLDASGFSPVSCTHVIGVGASTSTDARAAYSNYGSFVDIAAPGGEGIDPNNYYQWILSLGIGNQVYINTGTSFAAPHVSGAAALVLSLNPQMTPDQVFYQLLTFADPIQTDRTIGPRLNVYRVLSNQITPSVTPTLTPTPTNTPTLTPTNTPIPTPTVTPTPIPTNTPTPMPTNTPTPTRTPTPMPTSTPVPTLTPTISPTNTPTPVPTPTPSLTPSLTPSPTGQAPTPTGQAPTPTVAPTPTTIPTASLTPSSTPTNTPTPTPGPPPGDANGDYHVDVNDYKIWRAHFRQRIFGSSNGDFNNDSMVNGLDYIIWFVNFGKY